MKFRLITAKDDQTLAGIIRQQLKSHGLALTGTAYTDPELDHLSNFYQGTKRRYYVVVNEDDQVLGGAGFAELAQTEGVAELQKLYLSPAAKGSGLSYQILDQVERGAKEAGFKQLYLETHTNLKAAIHIYEKAGFKLLDDPLTHPVHQTVDRFYLKDL